MLDGFPSSKAQCTICSRIVLSSHRSLNIIAAEETKVESFFIEKNAHILKESSKSRRQKLLTLQQQFQWLFQARAVFLAHICVDI